MMMFPRALITAIGLLTATAGLAAAEEIELFPEGTFDTDPRAVPKKDESAGAEEEALRNATYCDQYGPNYVHVEGTTTCIQATGHVQFDVYVKGMRR